MGVNNNFKGKNNYSGKSNHTGGSRNNTGNNQNNTGGNRNNTGYNKRNGSSGSWINHSDNNWDHQKDRNSGEGGGTSQSRPQNKPKKPVENRPQNPPEKLTKENYAEIAEKVMINLQKKDNYGNLKIPVTTTQIRKFLSMSNVLYVRTIREKENPLSADFVSDIQYLRMRFAYEAGRDKNVKNFVNKANIMKYIHDIGNDREKLLLFCRYMEALVAYHRFYGGRDQ